MKKGTETATPKESPKPPLHNKSTSRFNFQAINQTLPPLVFSYGQQPTNTSSPINNPISNVSPQLQRLTAPIPKPPSPRTPYPSPNSGAVSALGTASASASAIASASGVGTVGTASPSTHKPVLNITPRKSLTSVSPPINLSPAHTASISEVSPVNQTAMLTRHGILPPLSLPPPMNANANANANTTQQNVLPDKLDKKEAEEWQIIHQLPVLSNEEDEYTFHGNTKITCPIPDNTTINVTNGSLILDKDFGNNVLLLVENGAVYCKNVGVLSVIIAEEIECEDIGINAELRSSLGSIRSLQVAESAKLTAKTDIVVKQAERLSTLTAQTGTIVASYIEEGCIVFGKGGILTNASLTRMLRRL